MTTETKTELQKVTIPLGALDVPPIGSEHSRKQRWRSPVETTVSTHVRNINCGRYSSKCRYTKWDHQQHVESWGAVSADGEHLHYTIDTADGLKSGSRKAPRGWTWQRDKLGIKIVSLANAKLDYHPTALDILDPDVRALCRAARQMYKVRRANEREARRQAKQSARLAAREARLTKQAEKLGVWVCLRDSLAYGNCEAGTLAFAANYGLNPALHYTPQQLLTLVANGDRSRVAGAIACALRRAKQEIEQGYCLLSDHQ